MNSFFRTRPRPSTGGRARPRKENSKKNAYFPLAVDTSYTTINLPHTYNAADAFDDAPSYYRGKAYYRKAFPSRSLDPECEHYLRIQAANQNARVWLNGREVGAHRGGYTAFTFNLTEYLNYCSDTLLIELDNRHDPDVPPLRGDFNFYGGIYREVELIHVQQTHFTTDFYGATAVFIDPLEVEEGAARWSWPKRSQPCFSGSRLKRSVCSPMGT